MAVDLERLRQISEQNRRREEDASRLNVQNGRLVAPSRLALEDEDKGGSRPFFGGLGSLIRKGQHVAQKALDLPAPELVPTPRGKKQKKEDRKTVGQVAGQRLGEISSGEKTANTLTGSDVGTRVREQIERVPRAGGVLGTAADVATAPGTLISAGTGTSGVPLGRLFSEVVSGVGSTYAADLAEEKDAPAPVVLASGLAGGVFGFWSGQAARGSGKALLKEASGLFNRNSARAVATEYGHNIGNRTFVADLLPFEDVRGEIRGPTNAVEASAAGRKVNAAVNPSKNYEGELGPMYNTFVRQTRRGQQLAEVAVSSALDPHERGAWLRGPGGQAARLFDIADDGVVKNITAPSGRSAHWSDVFSTPDAPSKYGMSAQQKAYFEDFRQVLDETDEFLAANGIQRYKVKSTDKLYVPRIVRGKNGMEIERTTNPRLARVFETAEDGVRAGIQYENDPRAVLGLYVEAAYREVAQKQLDDAMAPFLVSPKNVLNKTQPKVVDRVVKAAKDLREARTEVRAERRSVIRDRADVDKDILREAKRGLTSNPDAGRMTEPGAVRQVGRVGFEESKQLDPAISVDDFDGASSAVHASLTQQEGDALIAYIGSQRGVKALRYDRKAVDALSQKAEPLREWLRSVSSDGYTIRAYRYESGAGTNGLESWSLSPRAPRGFANIAKSNKPITVADIDIDAIVAPGASGDLEILVNTRRPPGKARPADVVRGEIRESISEAENFKKGMTNVRSPQGPPITDAMRDRLAAAQTEWYAARAAYKRALDQTRNKELLPEYVFGKNNNTGLVRVGTWKGKFLPDDADYQRLSERINTMTGRPYPTQVDPISRGMQNIGSTVRFTSAIGDLAMPFIQGLPLLGQNPAKWAKMAALHYAAGLNPKVYSNYLRRNLSTVQEMAQHGVPIGDIETFVAGEGGLLRRAVTSRPGQQTVGRLAQAYDTGLTANRVQLWNAMKPHWDGTPEQLASYVRNMTGGLDSAALGVAPTQRAWESVWLGFSPRLMRSTLALVAKAGNPSSAEGQQAARSLLGLAGFATGMAVLANEAIGHYKGESDEQIKQRIQDSLDPLGGRKFLSVEIGGQYIGVGGQVRAISQFVAKAIANPAGFATADQYENPLINYYMSRGSVGVNIAGAVAEGATGERVNVLPFESIDSMPDAVLHIGKSSLPFVIQAQMDAEGASNLDRAAMAAIGFGGLNYSEMTASAQVDRLATEQYGKPYAELTGAEQQRMEAERPELFKLRDKQRAETAGPEARQKRQELQQADIDRMDNERRLVDAYKRGQISGPQFRDEMKALQRDAVVRKKQIRGDDDYKTTDENKLALSAWYDTFDQARIAGTQIVDWDLQETLEADLYGKLSPEQRRYIDERRVTEHDPDAQFYFDNEMLIRDAGYYESKDTAFERYRGRMPEGIESYSQLALALDAAQRSGDVRLAKRLSTLRNAVDRVDTQQKERLRRRNPDLDRALLLNGRTTKVLSRQALT